MHGFGPQTTELGVLLSLEQAVRQTYSDRRSSAIQPLQWSILRYLQTQPRPRCQLRYLAEHLQLTRAPVGRAVKTLEARGLLRQTSGAGDMRTKTIKLTEAGRQVLAEDPMRDAARRFAVLPEADKRCFQGVIEQIFPERGQG